MRLWRNEGSWMRDSGGEWGKDLNAFFFEVGDYVPYGLMTMGLLYSLVIIEIH